MILPKFLGNYKPISLRLNMFGMWRAWWFGKEVKIRIRMKFCWDKTFHFYCLFTNKEYTKLKTGSRHVAIEKLLVNPPRNVSAPKYYNPLVVEETFYFFFFFPLFFPPFLPFFPFLSPSSSPAAALARFFPRGVFAYHVCRMAQVR